MLSNSKISEHCHCFFKSIVIKYLRAPIIITTSQALLVFVSQHHISLRNSRPAAVPAWSNYHAGEFAKNSSSRILVSKTVLQSSVPGPNISMKDNAIRLEGPELCPYCHVQHPESITHCVEFVLGLCHKSALKSEFGHQISSSINTYLVHSTAR